MPVRTALQIGAIVCALYARLIFHLEQVVAISCEIRATKRDWQGAPVLIVRDKAEDTHSNLLVTRIPGERSRATGFNTDERLDATLVYVDRMLDWAEDNVPAFDRAATVQSADDHPYARAAKYFKEHFVPNPDAQSVKDMRSRYNKAFEAGDIFFKGCCLSHVQVDSIKDFRDWLQGLPTKSPLGRSLPHPPVRSFNSACEAAQKARILISALDFYGGRRGNGWRSGVNVPIIYPVNREFHDRPALFRILWVLVFNKRFGLKDPMGKPNMRYCPYIKERFEIAEFKPRKDEDGGNRKENEKNKEINKQNDHSCHMLGRLVQVRYHLASRSVDSHVLCHEAAKAHGYVKIVETHPTDLSDLARGFVFRQAKIAVGGKKGVADAPLPGKLASIMNSWRRSKAEREAIEELRANGKDLHMIRDINGGAKGDYWRELWNEAQAFAKVDHCVLHTIKKSGVTDSFYGGHTAEELEDFIGTSQPTLWKVYRLVKKMKEYTGPAWKLGPGVPPWFRAERRKDARERGLPYPF